MAKKTRKQQNGKKSGGRRAGVRQNFTGTSAQPHTADGEQTRAARKNGGASAARTLLGGIKRHPVSATLVGLGATCAGLGATYLWMNARASRAIGYGRPTAAGSGEQLGKPSLTDAARDNIARLGNGTGQLARRAQASLGGAAHVAGTKATQLMHDAGMQGRRLSRAAEETFIAHPLAVGAAALAVGTAIGLAIPSTVKEGRWLGRRRDAVVDRAQGLARDAMDGVNALAKQALRQSPARASA